MTRLPVAAVVVRWKGGDEVQRCVASLGDAGEVVVVDNGSADGGAERLSRTFPEVAVEALAENLGFAGGVNHGVAATTEPLVLILNPDAALGEGALATLVNHLETDSSLAGVAPALLGGDGVWDHGWQCRRLPRWIDLGLGRSGRPAFGRPPVEPAVVGQPAAAAWLIRREVFVTLDGLDTTYHPAWWEDVDFCARLQASGGAPRKWEVVPEARAVHQGGSSVPSLGIEAFLGVYHRNLARYALRHHPQRRRAIRAMLRVSLRMRAAVRPKQRSGFLAAWAAARQILG